MSVYMIIDIKVKNENLYSKYIQEVYNVVTKYGGKYLVRGNQVTPVTDNWNPDRIIIIEFKNNEELQKCFKSPEYVQIAPLREKSTISKAVIVEGYK